MDRHLPLRPGLGRTRAAGGRWSSSVAGGRDPRFGPFPQLPVGRAGGLCSQPGGLKLQTPLGAVGKRRARAPASARALAPLLIAANFISLTLFTLEPLNCFPFIFSNFIMH